MSGRRLRCGHSCCCRCCCDHTTAGWNSRRCCHSSHYPARSESSYLQKEIYESRSLTRIIYSGTSNKGLSEKGTTSQQRTHVWTPFPLAVVHYNLREEDSLSTEDKNGHSQGGPFHLEVLATTNWTTATNILTQVERHCRIEKRRCIPAACRPHPPPLARNSRHTRYPIPPAGKSPAGHSDRSLRSRQLASSHLRLEMFKSWL